VRGYIGKYQPCQPCKASYPSLLLSQLAAGSGLFVSNDILPGNLPSLPSGFSGLNTGLNGFLSQSPTLHSLSPKHSPEMVKTKYFFCCFVVVADVDIFLSTNKLYVYLNIYFSTNNKITMALIPNNCKRQNKLLGAIQIIRDTLGVGVQQSVT